MADQQSARMLQRRDFLECDDFESFDCELFTVAAVWQLADSFDFCVWNNGIPEPAKQRQFKTVLPNNEVSGEAPKGKIFAKTWGIIK